MIAYGDDKGISSGGPGGMHDERHYLPYLFSSTDIGSPIYVSRIP